MAKDANFKQYLEKLLKKTGAKSVSSLKVGDLPLEIDLLLTVTEKTSLKYFDPLNEVVKHSESKKIIIEYKSHNDLLALRHLYKIIAYRALYLSKNIDNVNPADVCITVITTQLPRKILHSIDSLKLKEGIYILDFEFPIYLITINYLTLERKNYGLLFFSTGKTLKKFVRLILKNDNRNEIEQMFISYTTIFHYEEYIMASSVEEIPKLTRNIKNAVQFLGIKEVIQAVGIKETVQAVGLKEVIGAVGLKEVIGAVGLKEVIDAVGLKEVFNTLDENQREELKKYLSEK